jgi:uncharacterized protein YbaR (Trm112 family)
MSDGSPGSTEHASRLAEVLFCVECGANLRPEKTDLLRCGNCGASYDIEAGTARMLPRELREPGDQTFPRLLGQVQDGGELCL